MSKRSGRIDETPNGKLFLVRKVESVFVWVGGGGAGAGAGWRGEEQNVDFV